MTSTYRTRFAPSPTGKMHPGHARTALATWLRARKAGGTILMRFEDIDQPRVVEGAADSILRDHEWLGLDWDEGPVWQSSRFDVYQEALETLQRQGDVYPCTCSRREIAAVASAPHGDDGPRYPGTCRRGPTRPGREPSLRFRFAEPSPGFDDVVCGRYPEGAVGGDFVVRRADGVWAYQLAVVVDDAQARISEIVRGDDLLSSTPRQLALYRALGYPAPGFAHVPLVTDGEGVRLATRHKATSIESLRSSGRSAESVIGELAFSLGIAPNPSPIRPQALVSAFELGSISRVSFAWPSGG
ncbi:MAG: tRNA glutamyl-Q(34) synthetase GluQRS [Polyangiales bacterium]